MAIDALTGFDFDNAAGTLTVQEMKTADDHLLVQFFLFPVVDQLLTDGGEIPKAHPRVKELRQRELARFEALKAAVPFEEAEPEDEGSKADWKARKAAHEEELRQQACVLQEHPDNNKLYVVPKLAIGRPVYTEQEFIRIIKPGDRDSVFEAPLDNDYRKRFASRYNAWKLDHNATGAVGVPLSEVPFITSAQREEFKHFGVHTAEQLVNLSDNVKQHFMGINTLIQKVQRWLDATTGSNATVEKLAREAEARDAELNALRTALAEMQAQLAKQGAVPSTGRVNDIVEKAAAESKRARG